MHPFYRTELLVGREGWQRLKGAAVLVVGLGGVGSYAAEALARAGVAKIGLCDFDAVCVTNVNRQLHALRRTVGQSKAALMDERVRAINPKTEVHRFDVFYGPDTSQAILAPGWTHVVDCIDNVSAKLHLLQTARELGLVTVTAMGAGGRLDPSMVRVSDLAFTRNDALARVVRRQLRRRGLHEGEDGTWGITAVWSEEPQVELDADVAACFRCICPDDPSRDGLHDCEHRHVIQGTVSFLPAMFGLAAAGAVVNQVLGRDVASAVQARAAARPPRRLRRGRPGPAVEPDTAAGVPPTP